ncbi:MarR family winged helix-turn-helix transcriptional regulator [Alcaligenes faecalis]|uniref:MarR family winged helix-turn-helix transcriptional regulator n=1 Tax=Alcaligenes faecalis TaxID=511 RepID=UPI0029339614|nr:MarR family transcriptional regulator [Alcaligenes faecalis]MDV2117422.1 MarR family transcriptional regulator [Alcaligenes faecalis]
MNYQLYERFGLSMIVLARLYRRELDQTLVRYGVSEATILPIRYLAQLGEPIRQGQLARMMRLEGPTLVRLIDQLESGGLLERLPDEQDKRARLLRLTEKGRDFHERLLELLRQSRAPLFQGIADEDIEAALRCFDQLASNLGLEARNMSSLFGD